MLLSFILILCSCASFRAIVVKERTAVSPPNDCDCNRGVDAARNARRCTRLMSNKAAAAPHPWLKSALRSSRTSPHKRQQRLTHMPRSRERSDAYVRQGGRHRNCAVRNCHHHTYRSSDFRPGCGDRLRSLSTLTSFQVRQRPRLDARLCDVEISWQAFSRSEYNFDRAARRGRPGISALRSSEPLQGSVPSTIKAREFVDFLRIPLISSWAAELYQALALSMLSKEMMTKRFGGVPSSATIFSVRTTFLPPKAAVAAPA
jgi:hypothetical protein